METSPAPAIEHDSEPVKTFEWCSDRSTSSAVVMAMGEVTGPDPTDLKPLYAVVDGDSLDRFFDQPETGRGGSDRSVSFEYEGRLVVVEANGRGYIYAREGPDASTAES